MLAQNWPKSWLWNAKVHSRGYVYIFLAYEKQGLVEKKLLFTKEKYLTKPSFPVYCWPTLYKRVTHRPCHSWYQPLCTYLYVTQFQAHARWLQRDKEGAGVLLSVTWLRCFDKVHPFYQGAVFMGLEIYVFGKTYLQKRTQNVEYEIRSRAWKGPQWVKGPEAGASGASCKVVWTRSVWNVEGAEILEMGGEAQFKAGNGCPSSPVAEQLSENWELHKMNLRVNTKMFSNYHLCFITLCKMSMLK